MKRLGAASAGCGRRNTFEEGPAVDEVTPVREARAARTELGVLRRAFLRTFVTFRAPGYTHRAAAGVHTVLPRDRGPAALVLVGEVALLRAQVWKAQIHILQEYVVEIIFNAHVQSGRNKKKQKTTLTPLHVDTHTQYPPMHVLPLTSTVIPGGHWQKKEPGVLMHLPLMHTPGNT